MAYETLIRKVYKCGRNFEKGADADIYRRMSFAYDVIEDPNWGKDADDKKYDFRKAFSKVKGHVHDALWDGIGQIRYKVTKDDLIKLEEMRLEISDMGFYDKQRAIQHSSLRYYKTTSKLHSIQLICIFRSVIHVFFSNVR